MVSWLPWRGDSSSTASFEKTLLALSTKITSSQTRLDKLRASSRRVKVLATLYLSFAYLVFTIVAFLVIGTRDLGQSEWVGVIAGPFLIFGVRKILAAFYNYQIERLSARLKDQQAERAKTIQKLKDATKYDSTQELIQKYGGAEGGSKSSGHEPDAGAGAGADKGKRQRPVNGGSLPERTTMPPPPTANIQRRDLTPSSQAQASLHKEAFDPMEPTAEFAPNAGAVLPDEQTSFHQHQKAILQAPPPPAESSHWYDRIFDVLLGEDETAPKNRIVLICQNCRIVNGQAPPGTRSLAELGRWRCMSCGAPNGVEKENEGERIVREVLGNSTKPVDTVVDEGSAHVSEEESAEMVAVDVDEKSDDGPSSSVRKRRNKSKK